MELYSAEGIGERAKKLELIDEGTERGRIEGILMFDG